MILIILPVGCVLLSSVFCLLLPPPPLYTDPTDIQKVRDQSPTKDLFFIVQSQNQNRHKYVPKPFFFHRHFFNLRGIEKTEE